MPISLRAAVLLAALVPTAHAVAAQDRPDNFVEWRAGEIVRANAGRNVLVHCQVNLRGSSFVFLYRVIHEKAPIGETAIKLNAVWAPDRVWRRFIDQTLEAHGRKGELF